MVSFHRKTQGTDHFTENALETDHFVRYCLQMPMQTVTDPACYSEAEILTTRLTTILERPFYRQLREKNRSLIYCILNSRRYLII